MQCIRPAEPSESERIDALILEAFGRGEEFVVRDAEQLRWDPSGESTVLAGWNMSGDPVSTTRGTVVADREAAEVEMECTAPADPSLYPALLLSKAGTVKGLGRTGLQSALRYHFMRAALDSDINAVIGVVYQGAPRTGIMKELGYDFRAAERRWYTDLQPSQPTLVAYLERLKLPEACRLLRQKVSGTLDQYPWRGEALHLPGASSVPPRVTGYGSPASGDQRIRWTRVSVARGY